MIVIDYHRFKLDDAMTHVEALISNYRINSTSEDVEFITGYGIIRTELITLLKSYGLDPKYKLGNQGTILCLIE
jgi:hypothetical protein